MLSNYHRWRVHHFLPFHCPIPRFRPSTSMLESYWTKKTQLQNHTLHYPAQIDPSCPTFWSLVLSTIKYLLWPFSSKNHPFTDFVLWIRLWAWAKRRAEKKLSRPSQVWRICSLAVFFPIANWSTSAIGLCGIRVSKMSIWLYGHLKTFWKSTTLSSCKLSR